MTPEPPGIVTSTRTPNPAAPRSCARVVAIVGPTAVGKSEVAEAVALALNGEIVSADSMQVYRGMDIGTAKAPQSARKVPHHCLDLVDPGEPFSAALYQLAAREAIAGIASRGRVAVMCGGTGLYVRAALDDFVFPPGEQTDNESRTRYELYAETHGAEALHALLASRDPDSAALVHANNVRRVVRALEMLDCGQSYAEQHEGFARRGSVYDTVLFGLTMERSALYARIDTRVDAMIEAGLVDEVRSLLERGFREGLTSSQAIGYRELVPVVEGKAPLAQAVVEIKKATRHYAKRQLTWFRADQRIRWLDMSVVSMADAPETIVGSLDW